MIYSRKTSFQEKLFKIIVVPIFIVAFLCACSGDNSDIDHEITPIKTGDELPELIIVKNDEVKKEEKAIDGKFVVNRVVNVKTINVFDGTESTDIALLGIDDSHLDNESQEKGKLFLEFLLIDREIILEIDTWKQIELNAFTGYVYVDGIMVNKELLSKGLVTLDSTDNKLMHWDILVAAENKAKSENIGFWELQSDDVEQNEDKKAPRMGCGTLPCQPKK